LHLKEHLVQIKQLADEMGSRSWMRREARGSCKESSQRPGRLAIATWKGLVVPLLKIWPFASGSAG